MTEHRGMDMGGGKSVSHGYKAKTVRTVAETTTMDSKRTETHGYKPATSQSRPAPPKPPAGDGGGSK